MRELTSHKSNSLNESVKVEVADEPGSGGAHHKYQFYLRQHNEWHKGARVEFQKGPIEEVGVNGISNESLLAIVLDRLECFEKGPFANKFNQKALEHVESALMWLHARTKDRVTRGVEGKFVK